jgi:hypothetical protein
MGNRSWLYFEHSSHAADEGDDTEETSATEIAEANNNFPVLWQILLAEGAAADAIDTQRVFGDAGTDNLASDARAALARIRRLHAFVERHPMLHTLPHVALQFEALALHLAALIDQAPDDAPVRLSANLDELSWLGGGSGSESFIERNRRECNARWSEVRRCIDSGNHPGVDAALGIQRFADWEAWAWQFGFGGIQHSYFDGSEPPRDERFADFEPEEDDDGNGDEDRDWDNHLGGDLWRFEVDGRWGVLRIENEGGDGGGNGGDYGSDSDSDGDSDGEKRGATRTTVVEPAWDDIRPAGADDTRLLWISLAGRSGLLLADADAPRVLLAPQLDEDWNFEDGIATALVGDHIGLLRTDGTWLLKPSVDEAWSFAEGMVRARVGERIGYVDLQGRWAIEPRFAEADDFAPGGLAPARIDGAAGGWCARAVNGQCRRISNFFSGAMTGKPSRPRARVEPGCSMRGAALRSNRCTRRSNCSRNIRSSSSRARTMPRWNANTRPVRSASPWSAPKANAACSTRRAARSCLSSTAFSRRWNPCQAKSVRTRWCGATWCALPPRAAARRRTRRGCAASTTSPPAASWCRAGTGPFNR